MVNQGYAYKVVTKLTGIEDEPDMMYKTHDEQVRCNIKFVQMARIGWSKDAFQVKSKSASELSFVY